MQAAKELAGAELLADKGDVLKAAEAALRVGVPHDRRRSMRSHTSPQQQRRATRAEA